MAVVCYSANDPYSPRGMRTRAVLAAPEDDWSIELHASSSRASRQSERRPWLNGARRQLRRAGERVVLDKCEGWSRVRGTR
jgi:hypothetical protein